MRAELLSLLAGAQSDLACTIATLRAALAGGGSPGAIPECESQFQTLAALQQNVSTANPAALAAMKSQVAAAVATSTGLAQQASAVSGAPGVAMSPALAAANAASRQEVQTLEQDLFDRHLFDPYLNFSSAEDEAAYRRREAEAKRYIDAQLARNTPEGNLNAEGGAIGQMLDAHAHGAGNSPDFLPRWNALVAATHEQHERMRQEGRSTEEFDRYVKERVRQYLKDKGLSDAQIEACLSSSSDPLDALTPYLQSDADARQAIGMINVIDHQTAQETVTMQATVIDAPVRPSPTPIEPSSTLPVGLDDVMAKLQASGVTSTATTGDTPTHGVAAREPNPAGNRQL